MRGPRNAALAAPSRHAELARPDPPPQYTVSAKLSCDAAPNGTSLTECEWVTLSSGEVCTRNRLLRVTCSPLQYGDVRLSGQGGARQGQVMVYTASGQWLYPCGTMFDAASAAVVCDHLGYSGADRFTLGGGTPVIQVGPTTGWWPDSFSCTGKERNLTQCSDGALSSCGASVSDARRNIPILVCNQVQNADVVLPIAVGSFVIALCCGVATCSAVFCCCRRVETGGPRRGIVHGLGARWPLNRKAAARHRRGAGARREGGPADVVGLPALYPPPPPPPPPAETKEGGGGGTVASRRHAGGGRGGGASVAAHV